jgi:hypothetical protein
LITIVNSCGLCPAPGGRWLAQPPGELPASAQYRVLPEIEAAVAVRTGPAASIFPMVYHDLVRWIEERGYQVVTGPGREVMTHEVDDIADVAQQVIEIQLPLTRPVGGVSLMVSLMIV